MATQPTYTNNAAVKRTAKGGIAVNEMELQLAFQYLDHDQKGSVNLNDLKRYAQLVNTTSHHGNTATSPAHYYSTKQLKQLLLHQPQLTAQQLSTTLRDNNCQCIDPIYESFMQMSPDKHGFLSNDRLKDLLTQMGFNDVSDGDLQVLITTLDVDRDGKIGLEDWRAMTSTKQLKAMHILPH